MNWLDIAIITTIDISTLTGLRFGIIKALLSLAGSIVGLVLARQYYIILAPQLTFIANENAAKIAAFATILIGATIIAALLAWLLKWITSIIMLEWVNRAGGAVFGLAAGSHILQCHISYLGQAYRYAKRYFRINYSNCTTGLLSFGAQLAS